MWKRLNVWSLLLAVVLPVSVFASAGLLTNQEARTIDITVTDNISATRLAIDATEISVESVQFGNERYDLAQIDNEPTTSMAGWPELPIISRMVLVPSTSDIRVVVHSVNSRIEDNFSPFILPAQDGSVSPDLPGIPTESYVNYDGFWPPEMVVVGEPAIIRGHRIVTVTTFPVQYNPNTRQVRFNDNIDFELVYEGVGDNIVPDNRERHRQSTGFQDMVDDLVVNPLPRRDNPMSAKYGSYMLIYPSTNGVEEALQPLIEWRARQGWDVHAIDVGNASNNAIKDIIEEAYEEWENPPEMITLVGDADGTVRIPVWNNFTDLDYVLLDGNDRLADAHIGRLSVNSVGQLETVVAKLVNYEADPYMGEDGDDTDWYLRGMACAGSNNSGLSTIMMNDWIEYELLSRGYQEVAKFSYRDGGSVPNFFRDQFAEGVSFAHYRGWIGMGGTSYGVIMGFRRHRRYPTAIIPTCASGHFIGQDAQTEGMLRSEGGANGAVGFCTSSTHTKFNNAVAGGIWAAFLKHGHYHWGAATNYGRLEVYRQYNGLDNGYANFMSWLNLMGDAATHIFTGIPQLIEVDHDETIALGSSHFTLNVFEQEDEVASENALVCLYKEDDGFQLIQWTDENGDVSFTIPTDALTDGEMMVTVTKHNTKPYLGTVVIEEAELYLGAGDWNVDDEDGGDGDAVANPGETINLSIDLTNFGSDTPEGEVTVTAEALSEWIEITGEPVVLNEAPRVGNAISVSFSANIHAAAPDESIGLVSVDASVGDNVFHSVAAVEVESPKLVITRIFIEGGRIEPGEVKTVDFEVRNDGHKAIDNFMARLSSESSFVTAMENESSYDALNPNEAGRLNGNQFRVRSHPFTIPGMEANLLLEFETEAGFQDQSSVSITIGSPEDGDPFGPDDYGYVCFDSGDDEWEMAPVYDWVEIDPDEDNNDFDGTNTGISDNGNEQDESVVVDLPFTFQYYGQRFQRITICSNGWAAMGNWENLAHFRNRRIASGNGPNSQICVFWDNLIRGKILTHYDEEDGRFIVEWNDMSREYEALSETFELILYDPDFRPTYTGDGIIDFQYKDFNNGNAAPGWGAPYATVGIGNLDDTDGLEYTYWNRYTDGATPLDDGMAIRFTTAIEYITGELTGTVRDLETGEPIVGAWIFTNRGFADDTDENGVYLIDDILVSDNYMVTASAQWYNDSTQVGEDGNGYTIREGETLVLDFDLRHPEFSADVDNGQYNFTMKTDSLYESIFTIINGGNGVLDWDSKFSYIIGDDPEGGPQRRDDAWDMLLRWTAMDSVDDTRLHGVVFTGDYWFVTGRGDRNEPQRWFYRFDPMGNYVDRIEQPVQSTWGIRDMDFFNGFIYGVDRDINTLFIIDPESAEIEQQYDFPELVDNPQGIAVDPRTGQIWVTGVVNDLHRLEIVDGVLSLIDSYHMTDPRDNGRLDRYGLAWFADEPEGYNLYIMTSRDINDDDVHPDMSLFKMNPEDQDIQFVNSFNDLHPRSAGKGGMIITPKWNNLVWVLAAMIDNPIEGDYVAIFEIAPNSSWIDYQPREGTLGAEATQICSLKINTADLDTGSYGVVVEFSHNARDGEGSVQIPVNLHVVDILPDNIVDEFQMPFEYALEQNWPNPFNPSTTMSYTLQKAGLTQLRIYDVMGRKVGTLLEKHQPAGNYRISFDGSTLPAGVYFYRLESGSFKSVKKMVLIK